MKKLMKAAMIGAVVFCYMAIAGEAIAAGYTGGSYDGYDTLSSSDVAFSGIGGRYSGGSYDGHDTSGSTDASLLSLLLGYTVILDITAPVNPASISGYSTSAKTTGLTSGSWYNYNTSGTSPYFEWAAGTDTGGTGVAGYYVYWGTTSGADPVTAGTYQTGLNFTNNATLTSGTTYYLNIKAKDTAGNPAAASAQFTYKCDNTAPANPASISGYSTSAKTTGLTSGSWYTYNTSGASPYFEWAAGTDTGGSGVAGYYVYWGTTSGADPVTAGTYQTGLNFTNNATLTSGTTYYLNIKAKDNVGYAAATSVQFTYKCDTSAPTASIAYTAGWQSSTGISVAKTHADSESGLQAYELQAATATITNGTVGAYSAWSTVDSTATSPYTATGTSGTAYKYRYRVQNNAGTWCTYYDGGEIKIDTGAPAIGAFILKGNVADLSDYVNASDYSMAKAAITLSDNASGTLDIQFSEDPVNNVWGVYNGTANGAGSNTTTNGSSWTAGTYITVPNITAAPTAIPININSSGQYAVTGNGAWKFTTDGPKVLYVRTRDATGSVTNLGFPSAFITWQYRKPITITGSASTLTDYQVLVDPSIYDNTGLVGSWHFSENTGTAAADMSGSGNSGTLSSASAWTASGRFGSGFYGSGSATSYFMSAGDTASLKPTSNLITLEAWIKLSTTTGYQQVIHKFNASNQGYSLAVNYGTANRLSMWVGGDTWTHGAFTWDTNWHYVLGTYDGTNVRLYVDGAPVGSPQAQTANLSGDVPLNIGRHNSGTNYFSGLIDEVKIYSRALTAAEISARYNNYLPKVRHDYADIRFADASGTDLPYSQETDAGFWVKVNTIPTSGTTIYEYYGKLSASSAASALGTRTPVSPEPVVGAPGTEVYNGYFDFITLDATLPNAPTGASFTAIGGTVTSAYINNTNTGFTANFTSPGTEYAGTAHLYIGGIDFSTAITTPVSAGSTPGALTGNAASITQLGAEGAKALTVVIIDAAGNIGPASNTVNITKDITSPTGSITAPADNANIVSTTPPGFTATASDTNGVASVKFQYKASTDTDYTLINTDTGSPYAASWGAITLTNGTSYNLRILVTDTAGNTTTSSAITINCDTSIHSYTITGSTPHTAGIGWSETVTANDVNGDTLTADSTTVVTMTNSGNASFYTSDTYATPKTPATYQLANGVAAIYIKDNTAQNITLTVTDSNSITATSSSIAVNSVDAPSKLGFTQGLSATTTAGTAFSTQPKVALQDIYGNTVTSATGNVTLTITANPGSGTLSGTATVAAVNGVATFSGLSIDKAGVGYILTATRSGLTSADSDSFNITVNSANKIVFTSIAQTINAGSVSAAYTVEVRDAHDNLRTGDALLLTLASSASSTGKFDTTAGGSFSGAVTTITTSGGIGTFYYKDTTGGTPTITVGCSGLTSGTQAQTIISLLKSKLAFFTQPSSSNTAGNAFGTQPAVAIQDEYGNTVAAATDDVTLSITTNPGSGTLSGTATVAAVNGVATFSGLSINKTGTGYILTAACSSLTSAASSSFNVTANSANKIVFTSTAQNLIAGSASGAYTVEVRDAYDNLRTGDALLLTLASSASSTGKFDTSYSGVFNGTVTSITTSGGVGQLYYKDTLSGTPTLTVSRSGLTSGTEAQTVSPAVTAKYTLNAPDDFAAGTRAPYTATRYDQFNNLKTALLTIGTKLGDYATGVNPRGICFDSSTNSIWVANGSGVSKFNASTGAKVGDYTTGANPQGVCFDSSTNSIWVTNNSVVSKFTASTGAKVDDYATGANPYGVSFDSSTNSIWVANNNAVSKFNASTGAKVGDYAAGTNPHGVCFDSSTNSIWVANYGSDTISKFNASDGAKVGDYATGANPYGVCFDSSTNSVWVANYGSATVSKINASTGVKTDYAAGTNPIGVTFDSSTNSIWVANYGSDNLSKFTASTGVKVGDYTAGTGAFSVCFDSSTGSVWAANYGSATVSKLIANDPAAFYIYSSPAGGTFYDAVSGGNIITGSSFADGSSAANFWYYDNLVGAYTITVSDNAATPDGASAILDAADSLNVLHGPPDHLRFQNNSNVATPQQAGIQFTLPKLEAMDAFENLADDTYSATPYSGSKSVTFSLDSGSYDAPDGGNTDVRVVNLTFSNGVSTTTPAIKLYRSNPAVKLRATPAGLSVDGEWSNAIVIHPEALDSVDFIQPTGAITSLVNSAASLQQPIVRLLDTYGNETQDIEGDKIADTIPVYLNPYVWVVSSQSYVSAPGTLTVPNSPLSASNCRVAFSGVSYDEVGTIVMRASAQGKIGYSGSIEFKVEDATTLEYAATPITAPELNSIKDTKDIAGNKFPVLRFKIKDAGADGVPTLIDQIKIDIAGTGGAASTDIAYAEITDGTTVLASTAAVPPTAVISETNDSIIFGPDANANGLGNLTTVGNGPANEKEYTVKICMKPTKLTAEEGATYIFSLNRTNIYTDTNTSPDLALSSKMASGAGTVPGISVGTIKVDVTHIQVLTVGDNSSITFNRGDTGTIIKLLALDANKNLDKTYTAANLKFIFSGLHSITNPATEEEKLPKTDETSFGTFKTIDFTGGVSQNITLKGYKVERADVSAAAYDSASNALPYLCPAGFVLDANVTLPANSANRIAYVSGRGQTGAVYAKLAAPCVVSIIDQYGNPVPNVTVTFAAVGGNSAGMELVSGGISGADGYASAYLILGSAGGSYSATAAVTGLIGSPIGSPTAEFGAIAYAPLALVKSGGDNQTGKKVLETLASFKVKTTTGVNGGGTPIPNVPITFAITSQPANLVTNPVLAQDSPNVTDAAGEAKATLTFGDKRGTYVVTATSGFDGSTQIFTVVAEPKPASQIVLTGPSDVNAGTVTQKFELIVKDVHGNSTPVTQNTVFDLTNYIRPDETTQATGKFYSDSAGTVEIANKQVTLVPSTSTDSDEKFSFYYKDNVTNSLRIKAACASGEAGITAQSASVLMTVGPAGLDHFTVREGTSSTATTTVASEVTLTVRAYDALGNLQVNAGQRNLIFTGASASPDNTDPTINTLTAFKASPVTEVPVTFDASGKVTVTFIPYKSEIAVIKASAGAAATLTNGDGVTVTVQHASSDHLKFSGNIPASQKAGVEFSFGVNLNVVDLYGNTCDASGTAFSSTIPITWSLTGDGISQGGPEGQADIFSPTNIEFTNGSSAPAVLKATLYRVQAPKILAQYVNLANNRDVASNTITVGANDAARLKFSQQPSGTCITSQALAQQPKVTVTDQSGNIISSFSGSVSISPFLNTNTPPTPAAHTLSAIGGLTATVVNGTATFVGRDMTYDYPESIYLRPSASTGSLTPEFSSVIAFTTAQEVSVSAGAFAESASISSLAIAVRTPVLDFKITDAGADKFDVNITQIMIKRNIYNADTNPGGDTTGGWGAYIKEAYIEGDDGSEMIGSITNDQIVFPSANSVPNNGSTTFTLKVILKNPLPSPADVDGKRLAFTMTPDVDIALNAVSSRFNTSGTSSAYQASPKIEVTATDLKITGTGTMNAGSSQVITLTAMDALGNTDKDFTGAGAKVLQFSGANPAVNPGYNPTVTVSGSTVDFGTNVGVVFTNGQSSSTVSITLYKAETAIIKASYTTSVGTSNSRALTVVVSGGLATSLAWNVQPADVVVENAPWNGFSVLVSDVYGNASPSNTAVTVTPSAGTLSPGAVTTVTADSQTGLATFSNFAVNNLTDAQVITISAVADNVNVTGSGPSAQVTVRKEYDITIAVEDFVSGSGITECVLDATVGGVRAGAPGLFPKSGNSPFTFKLPYGEYTFQVSKDKYLDENTTKTAGTAADYLDAKYDAKIAWKVTLTSLAESTADYRVMSSFVYDEDNTDLYVRLWLDRRGKLIMNSDVNKLGPAKVSVYDDVLKTWATIPLTRPDPADTSNGTYMEQVTNVLSAGNLFHKSFILGKVYFARCEIQYGGLNGTGNIYEAGATFVVTNTEKIGREVITKIGLAEGETVAGKIAEVKTDVSGIVTQMGTVSSAVTTMGDKVTAVSAEVAGMGSQVSSINANVTNMGTKVDTVQTSAASILEGVTTTLPAKVVADLEKGVMSEMLTRNTVLRVDDAVKIRYRTASKLAPTLTIYNPDGVILSDYNAVKMKEISNTGIYEYEVTATAAWGTGDFTVECAESTKGSKDSMVLTIKALFVAGAGVEESVDAVGEAVTKIYTRQNAIEGLLGATTDTRGATTIFGKVNGLNSTVDSLNLTTVSVDAKNARTNAQNVYNEMENIKKSVGDMQAQAASLRELSRQLEDMKHNLGKISQSTTVLASAAGTAVTTSFDGGGGTAASSGTTSSGGGGTTIITSAAAPAGTGEGEAIILSGAPRPGIYAKNYPPGTYRTKVYVSEGAVTVSDYNSAGSVPSTERRIYDGQSTVVVSTIGKEAGTGAITGAGTGIGAIGMPSDMTNLSNRVEELTALVKVLTRMIETTNNKPIVEGWFEQG